MLKKLDIKFYIKNFNFLEKFTFFSTLFVTLVLILVGFSAPSAYEKRQILIKNHYKVVDLINNEMIKCYNYEDGITIWGDTCNGEWEADRVVNYIRANLGIENPFSEEPYIKIAQNPKLKVEGREGFVTERGIIFLMSSNFPTEEGSKWVIGTCTKTPCLVRGNSEFTSIFWDKKNWKKLRTDQVN